MPLYEYECFVCKSHFERIQKFSDDCIEECPFCGGSVRRLLGVPALQFKGSGWYVTDYGKGNGRAKSEPEGSNGASSGNGKGSSEKSAESKPTKDKTETKNAPATA